MSDAENLEQAKGVFASLCQLFDENKWKCTKVEEQMKIGGDAQGEKGSYSLYFQVSSTSSLVRLVVFLPFDVPKEKSAEFAVVITGLNSLLASGCFAFDAQRELAFFRMSNSFYDSELDKEVYLRMLLSAVETVDMVADKLAAFVAGKIDMEQLLTTLAEGEGGEQ